MAKNFTDHVLHWVKRIPKGKVASYAEIAALAGSPGAARAVGQIMKNNNGTYSIICVHPKSNGRALEADNFTQEKNGGKIHLFFNTYADNQVWRLIEFP